MINKNLLWMKLWLAVFVLLISGCTATTEYDYGYIPSDNSDVTQEGIYHKVKSGESIWRIAETYNVSIDDVVESNKIPGVAKIETNQLVFIPGAFVEKEIDLGVSQEKEEFFWPVKGRVLKYFNDLDKEDISKGINIKTREGELVRASRSGKVVFADYLSGYGNTVILNHQDNFYTVYSRNAKLLVKLGDFVKRNNPIGEVSKTGNIAFLHFEIRRHAREENPLFYLP